LLSRRTIISTCLSAYPSIFIIYVSLSSMSLSICHQSLSVFINLLSASVCHLLPVFLSVISCLSVSPSIFSYLSACLSICHIIPVCLSVFLFTVKGRREGQSSETRSVRLEDLTTACLCTNNAEAPPSCSTQGSVVPQQYPPHTHTHTHITGRQKRFWLEGLCSLIHPQAPGSPWVPRTPAGPPGTMPRCDLPTHTHT